MTKEELENIVIKQRPGFDFIIHYSKESKRENVAGYFLQYAKQPKQLIELNNWYFISKIDSGSYRMLSDTINKMESMTPKTENNLDEVEKLKKEQEAYITTVYGNDISSIDAMRIEPLINNFGS